MATKTKISLKHGYTLHFNEDDTLFLKVETADDTLELEGKKGYLYFWSECVDDEDIDASPKLTLEEMLSYINEYFNDLNVDAETAEAIICDLTPWFERFAISEEEKVAQTIANLENVIAFRRASIERKMHNINSDNKLIAEANERIEADTKKVLELNKEITKYMNIITALKASLNGEKFISVEPCYTGGGIYVFTGHLADGNYFMASTGFYDVRILNADPNVPIEMSDNEAFEKYGVTRDEDAWASVEWQEEHLVKDLCEKDALNFFGEMLKWIRSNNPSGNYLMSDMDDLIEVLEFKAEADDSEVY